MSTAGRRTPSSSNELPVSRLQWSSLVIIMAVVKSSRQESALSGVELQFCSLGATDSGRVYLSCIPQNLSFCDPLGVRTRLMSEHHKGTGRQSIILIKQCEEH